jgi:hypothetical protein
MEKWTAGIFIGEKALEETAKRRAKALANAETHFKASLEIAESTLTLSYLDDGDRGAIEHAIHWIKLWLPVFLKSNDPADVREAGYWLAAYNKVIGARCEVCDTEAKYWEIKKRGGPKRPGKRNKATQAWRTYVRDNLPKLVQSNPDFNPKEIAEEFRLDDSAPKSMPKDTEYLTKFIRKELKPMKAKDKREALRLVQGGAG